MAVDAAGTLFVEDVGLGLVLRYRQGAAKEFLPLLGATDMAIDASGNLYFADKTGVRVVDGAGGAHARFAMCPTGASAVAVSSDGRLFALGEVGIFELPVTNTSVYDLGGTSLGGVSTGNLAVCNQLPLQSGINPVLSLAITGANASDFSQSSEVLGAASETGCSTHALLAKRTCLLTLHFSPTLTGTRSAVLSIKSNNVELLIPLSGTGVL